MELGRMNKFLLFMALCFMLFGNTCQAAVNLNTIGIVFSKFLGYSIDSVRKESSAEFAGLQKYDGIRRINNQKLGGLDDIQLQRLAERNEDIVTFNIGGKGDIVVYNLERKNILLEDEILEDIFAVPTSIKNFSQTSYNSESAIFDKYKKYYKFYPEYLIVKHFDLTEEEYKKLSKEEKKFYDRIATIQKCIDRKEYFMALSLDENYLPVYLYMYNVALKNEHYGNALYALEKINEFNVDEEIFNQDIINYHLGILYYMFNKKELGLKYLQPYLECAPETYNQSLSVLMAVHHLSQKNYSSAIYYLNQIKEDSKFYKWSLETHVYCYTELKNTEKAKEYLLKLNKFKESYDNYLRILKLTSNTNEIIYYAKKARAIADDYKKMENMNQIIIEKEQAKIANATKNFSSSYQSPNWKKYENKLSRAYGEEKMYAYQEDFFTGTNSCISKYKGNGLQGCFSTLTRKYNTLIAEADKKYERDLEYYRQKSLQDDLIREQKNMIDDLRREMRNMRY